MAVPKNYKQVLKHHQAQPPEIQKYFEHVPRLITADMPYDIALAYFFSRVEMAHRRALYCGIVKLYSANSELTDQIVRKEYLTRDGFKAMFKAVFSKEFPNALTQMIEHAEEMRDTGTHGRETTEADMRQAIHDVYEYAKMFNALVEGAAGFKPFGDLRGFKGRAENLDKGTTRWMLKGMGFSLK